jgi:23S rRNA pseudouridine955/2504/2580 synthase
MPVETRIVGRDDGELRLDRWFRRHYPALAHGRLEKLLRTGQVRVDGKRAKAGQRVQPGQSIRVPPLPDDADRPVRPRQRSRAEDAAEVRAWILHEDADLIVLNKPAGLAVQGGTRSARNLDAMLGALTSRKGEKPRLVHRLDKDTSGVLVLAKSARVAAELGKVFRGRDAQKLYWALAVGVPQPRQGEIDAPLAKGGGAGRERVSVSRGRGDAQKAVTRYAVVDQAGNRASWLALMPLTGRTHQLRVHCAALGTPILGDGKYGGRAAFLPGADVARQLHLHARRLILPHPAGGVLDVTAPLPPHMEKAWRGFNFDPAADDPFELDGPR